MSEPPVLTIVYQDEYLVVIDKPSGLLVHRSWIASDAQQFAMQILRDQIGQRVFPVHRLDRPTSGLLVFALSSEVARALNEQFAEREIKKVYHAVVRGYVDDAGIIDYALKEEHDKIADKQAQADKPAQEAVTEYQCKARVELPFKVSKKHDTSRYSLVKLMPKTGRKHQLRRHMSHIRHPIIGDTRHGEGRHNRFFRDHFDCHRLMLAATEIEFTHPVTGETLNLAIDVPEILKRPFQA
ncbi:tRNA pseudouridine synthase C [Idiomarina fontislapidosi]|uniref:tRNA pseudouridine synthase C n=1 Tax=Idiomarina fontislapidosi TaxID=263723 RepID=A0A432YBU1_9GAMM|nr:tRNA pseudouridine(65) synthase TruC [Idiomarina fontislapidosi]PYE35450.1 tRNA pseudouridine synthase C [Idiomarina fontislapidosi]RUO58332.1 tRNA pseudouridine(65) synthase TruC [Idiomarina fontislapidosi]